MVNVGSHWYWFVSVRCQIELLEAKACLQRPVLNFKCHVLNPCILGFKSKLVCSFVSRVLYLILQ